jgi:hypothetical protein
MLKLKRVTVVIVSIVFIFNFILWLLSAPLAHHFLSQQLSTQNITLSDDSVIRYNPFISQLTVEKLVFTKENSTVLSLQQLTLQLALHQLIFRQLVVQEFTVNSLYLQIEQNSKQQLIAGINLSQYNTTASAEAEAEKKSIPVVEYFIKQILLPQLTVSQSQFDLLINNQFHQVVINNLTLSNVIASQDDVMAELTFDGEIDNAISQLASKLHYKNQQTTLNSQISLQQYPLSKIKPYISQLTELSGFISVALSPSLQFDNQAFIANISNITLQPKQVNLALENFSVHVPTLTARIDNVKTTVKKDANVENFVASVLLPLLTIEQSQFDFRLNNQQHQLIINKLALNNVVANSNDVAADLTFNGEIDKASTQLTSTLLFKDQQTTLDGHISMQQYPLAKIKAYLPQLSELKGFISLNLSPVLKFNQQNISADISHITINPQQVNLALNKLALQIPSLTTTIDNVKATSQKSSANDYAFRLSELKLHTEKPMLLIDNNLTPPIQRSLSINELTLDVLDSQQGQKTTLVNLNAQSNLYEKILITSQITPFAQQPKYDLTGQLKELSLLGVSPYLKKVLPLEFQSGQLNSDITLSLFNDEINGNIDLLIKGLATTSADNSEIDLLKDNAMLPLNAALGLLTDSNGNLELSVPLSGSIDDPQFGIQSFITLIAQKAIVSATKSYLVKTFVPYANVVSVALSAGELLLKVRFEPLYYQLEQIAPDEKQHLYLQQLIQLLNDKKELHIKLCAVSVPADLALKSDEELTTKQQKSLLDIGQKREQALKEYLLKNSKIDSDRILFCAPKIDRNDQAKPRIELST